MKTIDTLRDEHDGVLAVLAQLEQAASAAAQGAPVPADIFGDIQEFFAVFVDRCHHGKEEFELFPRLTKQGSENLVHRLEADHTTGRRLASEYSDAVRGYKPGEPTSGARLAAAARAYATLLREHIDLETRELFPAIQAALVSEDQSMVDAFERLEEERIGPGTHERLHGMINELPARIAPWIKAKT